MSTTGQQLSAGRICPSCGGKGTLPAPVRNVNQVCPNCGGSGTLQPPVIRVPYDVVIPNVVLTALQAGVIGQQQLDQDADFEWVWTVSSQTGIYSVLPFDPSTGRQFATAAVNGENFAGTAQLPFPLVEPYIWARSSLVKMTFNDRSNSGNTIQMVLRGYKLYPGGNPAQGSQGAIVSAS